MTLAYDAAHLGVSPVARRGVHVYRRLSAPVAFTGRLLIGAGFVDIGYLNMGFRPAYGFLRVWELAFDAGRSTAAHNRSSELAAVRKSLADTRPGPIEGEATRDWINRTLSLTFAYSWPVAVPGR